MDSLGGHKMTGMSNRISRKLKELRMQTGLTLREFCQRTGLNPLAYSKLERGVFGPLSDEEVLRKLPALPTPKGDPDRLIELIRTT